MGRRLGGDVLRVRRSRRRDVSLLRVSHDRVGQALLMAPSRGRGGGIERYVETLEWAFAAQGVEYRRIDLHGSGLAAHVRLLAQSRHQLRASKAPARLIVAHRALLPAAS